MPADCQHCGLPIPASRAASGSRFCCLGCSLAASLAAPAAQDDAAPPTTLLLRLGLGIFLALNIMVASWLSYSREVFGDAASARGADAILPALFSYLALFLCTLLVALLAPPLAKDAVRLTASGGRRLHIQTEALILIGVLAAYLTSAFHTVAGRGSAYYDTAAVVLVVVTLGSHLEATAKQRAASAANRLLSALPARITARRGEAVVELEYDEVCRGDAVRVLPGETVPVDGRVLRGNAHIDEASLTGESMPRGVGPGERLLAGTVSLDGQLWLEAEQVGEDTVLAIMEQSLAEARRQRPPMQRFADRVAAVFVPGVVLLALAVFAWHAVGGRAERGLLDGLAVLLISCPCALGLAAPLATWHGLRRAAERGILIDSATTLERAAAIRAVVFDKTGTLTVPEPALDDLVTAPNVDPSQALAWAAGLESASTHPIARAVLDMAEARGITPESPQRAFAVAGLGIEGEFDGRDLRLGSGRWLRRLGIDPGALAATDPATHSIFLFDQARPLARFEISEEPRRDAAAAVAALRGLGLEVSIASGDREAPTRRLATHLGVSARASLLPDDKVQHLAEQRTKGPVAMVGDGLNDAPVLAAADVGIALGSASDLARRSGNVRLLSDRLDRVPEVFAIARDVRRRIRSNLIGAFAFNTVGIVLAALGVLTPVFAAVAMAVSSLTVIKISSSSSPRRDDERRAPRPALPNTSSLSEAVR